MEDGAAIKLQVSGSPLPPCRDLESADDCFYRVEAGGHITGQAAAGKLHGKTYSCQNTHTNGMHRRHVLYLMVLLIALC